MTWGTLLGPGLVTRNPYAGIWILPMLLVLHDNLTTAVALGVMTGMVHGAARALGVVHNRKHMNASHDPLLILTAQWRWRYMDGLVLLLTAGTLAAYIFSLLSARA